MLCQFVGRNLRERGFRVDHEHAFELASGITLKPDIIACVDDRAYIINARVVTDGVTLDAAHRNTCSKYNRSDLHNAIRSTHEVSHVSVTSLTVNWRGIISKQSFDDLLSLGALRKSDAALVSIKAALGSVYAFHFATNIVRTPGESLLG